MRFNKEVKLLQMKLVLNIKINILMILGKTSLFILFTVQPLNSNCLYKNCDIKYRALDDLLKYRLPGKFRVIRFECQLIENL